MSINLHPKIKEDQPPPHDPTSDVGREGLVRGEVEVGEGEEGVGEEVAGGVGGGVVSWGASGGPGGREGEGQEMEEEFVA